MPWQQFVIETDASEIEAIEAALFECGALSVSLEGAGEFAVLEPGPGETPLWPRMRLRALFEGNISTDAVLRQLEHLLPARPGEAEGDFQTLVDEDWAKSWLAHARPLVFGDRLCVTPSELAPQVAELAIVELEPGLAFGTGSHPSTAACLEWLAEAELEGARVLDYGCGSGVLAIAACTLGAARTTAVDIDAQARLACRVNAERNGQAGRVSILAPDRLAACGYDVVLANILARPLIDLAPMLSMLVRAGGALVLAGMLADQTDEVAAAYSPACAFAPTRLRDGWATLIGTRRDFAV
jgi:ribosomal protein L11 methyltransferase